MGSKSSKNVGQESIGQETTGGFHVLEVENPVHDGGNRKSFCGTKTPSIFNMFNIFYSQIHSQTASWGLATVVIILIVLYVLWRLCRRRLFKEQQRNLAASFHLSQSPTARVPIFSQDHRVTLENVDVPPPTYHQSVPQTAQPVQKYDIDRMIKSLE